MVLLHGWTVTADLNWFPSYAALGRRFRVLALDQRGHGRGVRSWRPFTLEDCADDVAALAKALQIERLVPVGYSMGGPVAQLLWRRHRDLVSGMVLCATARSFASTRPIERLFFSSLFGLGMAARATPPRVRRRLSGTVLRRRLDGAPLERWAMEQLRRGDPGTILQAGSALGAFSSHRWLGGVDVPTAVVVTTQDALIDPRRQLALARAIPDSRVFPVDGDHGVVVTDPRRFVPVLVDACTWVGARARAPQRLP
ncbi:MAG TPA: alpha/beta hydrolase [Acidimicrobiales bacterium]|nr:alpha/beta hydrolase [Acidimicrobiales bacterium]